MIKIILTPIAIVADIIQVVVAAVISIVLGDWYALSNVFEDGVSLTASIWTKEE